MHQSNRGSADSGRKLRAAKLVPQDSPRIWLIVMGLALGPAVSNGFARFAYGLLLPAMRDDLGWSYTQAGWINTANSAGYLIGALIALRTIPRLGPERLFVGGMLVTALAILFSGLTTDFRVLTFWRVVAGIAGAPVFIAGGVMVSSLFRDNASKSALAIAVYFGGGGLGMLLSGIALPLILDQMTAAAWPQTWLLMGVSSLVAFALSWWAVRSLRIPVPESSGTVTARLPVREMGAALAAYFLFALGYIVYMTFLVAWMQAHGAGAGLVVLTWTALSLAVMVSPFLWQKVLARSRGGAALSLSCAVTGFGTLVPLLLGGPFGAIVSACLFGLSFFIVPTAITSFSRKNLAEAQWGTAVALFTALFAIGQTIGPIAAGAIADLTDSIGIGLFGAGLTLLAAALVGAAQKPLKRI